MNKYRLFPVMMTLMVILTLSTSFASNDGLKTNHNNNTVSISIPQDGIPGYERGKEIYDTKCFVCHQANGKGIPGAFPPLDGADYLLADRARAVAQVLNGSNEEMVVNGITYKTPMPFQVDTKEDAIAVINYVLNSWSNKAGIVTPEEVKDIKVIR